MPVNPCEISLHRILVYTVQSDKEHCLFRCVLFLTVPWLEPNVRWKHSGGRGYWRLPWHLHLCALQCSRYHGTVPSGHSGAKGWSLCIDWCLIWLIVKICYAYTVYMMCNATNYQQEIPYTKATFVTLRLTLRLLSYTVNCNFNCEIFLLLYI